MDELGKAILPPSSARTWGERSNGRGMSKPTMARSRHQDLGAGGTEGPVAGITLPGRAGQSAACSVVVGCAIRIGDISLGRSFSRCGRRQLNSIRKSDESP